MIKFWPLGAYCNTFPLQPKNRATNSIHEILEANKANTSGHLETETGNDRQNTEMVVRQSKQTQYTTET